jgi:hypothetical protein
MCVEARKDVVAEAAKEAIVRSLADHPVEQPDQHGNYAISTC